MNGPWRRGRPGRVFAKLALPPFRASPPEQKAGVSLKRGRRGKSRGGVKKGARKLQNWRGFGGIHKQPAMRKLIPKTSSDLPKVTQLVVW